MNHISFTTAGVIVAACACLTACGESAEHKAADALLTQADSCIASGDYSRGIELIDSLNRAYPKEIELRKASDTKRAQAFEGMALSQIPRLDAAIDSLNAVISALYPDFKQEQSSSALNPYALYKTIAGQSLMASATLQPRVNLTADDAADTPWSIAVNAASNIGLNSATVVTKSGRTFTLSVFSSDGQVGTVTPEAADPLGQYLFENPGDSAEKATLSGTKGKAQAKLAAGTSQAIAESWNYATAKARLRASLVNRERVERQLQIARDQAANAAPAEGQE